MTELKTLKELDKSWKENYGDMLLPIVNSENELINDLRDVAREWIKDLQSDNPKRWTSFDRNIRCFIAEWIKHFFNLEEGREDA